MADTVRSIRELLVDYHCWHTFSLDCMGCDLIVRCKTETDKTLSNICTLVLAEVKKMEEQGNDCLTAHDIFNKIKQALTKLFEGGKER